MSPSSRFSHLLLLLGLFGFLILSGCGNRNSSTGALSGRVMDIQGNIVAGAAVYSLFNELEKTKSALDGTFFISELPAGRNQIVVSHPEYRTEVVPVEILNGKTQSLAPIKMDNSTFSAVISDSKVESVSSTTSTISWKTYREVKCKIELGLTRGYGTNFEEIAPALEHTYTFRNLNPDTVYHSRVGFFDPTQTFRFSVDIPFKTLAPDRPFPPQNVAIKPLTAYGTVGIEWSPSSSTSVVGYQVYRQNSAGGWDNISMQPLDRNTLVYYDRNLDGGRFYRYAVQAIAENTAASGLEPSGRVFMPGYINQEVVLTASDSPIVLYSDLIINPGATLHVEPGVEFRLAASDSFQIGKDPERVEVLILGRAVMKGLSGKPIKFSAQDGTLTRDYWAGIRVMDGKLGFSELAFLELAGCREQALLVEGNAAYVSDIAIRNSNVGMVFRGQAYLPPVVRCTFTDLASTAIHLSDVRWIEIASCTMTDVANGIGVYAAENQNILKLAENDLSVRETGIFGVFRKTVIRNCLIEALTGTGIHILNIEGETNAIDHCTIHAKNALKIELGAPAVENSIFVNLAAEGETGIEYLPLGRPLYAFNDVFGFTTLYQGCAAGLGAQTVNPGFRAGTPFSYALPDASPLKNSDRYGGEMGRYGKSYY